ncbi:hypothetical protein T4B_535 [Trichinella pseudospiralis]|uniref:Uncharacterized protein n=2 Tax=Trichinella pseudospiralis TaxID=6337 RepID=A0A0V1FE73_TRIPS|nr:hypothetical protein T4A_12582 [Trichinella pseudospiralis]KRY84363.1 hypothetical protein T4D_12670 [Trichinella pseudospiralis]KRZ26128.1 hypothetical protein T4C_13903 [Trichinella pseudospiralis]KRZ29829.1 hypothetical protein T4B_535 [Trichinella pseudospiralis]
MALRFNICCRNELQKMVISTAYGLWLGTVIVIWCVWQEKINLKISLSIGCSCVVLVAFVSVFFKKAQLISKLSLLNMASCSGRATVLAVLFSLCVGGPGEGIIENVVRVNGAISCAQSRGTIEQQHLQSAYDNAFFRMYKRINDTGEIWHKIATSVDTTILPLLNHMGTLNHQVDSILASENEIKASCIETLNNIYQHCSQQVAAVKEYCEDILQMSTRNHLFNEEQFHYLEQIRQNNDNASSEVINEKVNINSDAFYKLINFPTNFCQQLSLTQPMCRPIKSAESACHSASNTYKNLKSSAENSLKLMTKFRHFFSHSLQLDDSMFQGSASQTAIENHCENSFSNSSLSTVRWVMSVVKYTFLSISLLTPIIVSCWNYFQELYFPHDFEQLKKSIVNEKFISISEFIYIAMHLSFTACLLTIERLFYDGIVFNKQRYRLDTMEKLTSIDRQKFLSGIELLFSSIDSVDTVQNMLKALLNYFHSLKVVVDDSIFGCMPVPIQPTAIVWFIIIFLLYVLTVLLTVVEPYSLRRKIAMLERLSSQHH